MSENAESPITEGRNELVALLKIVKNLTTSTILTSSNPNLMLIT